MMMMMMMSGGWGGEEIDNGLVVAERLKGTITRPVTEGFGGSKQIQLS